MTLMKALLVLSLTGLMVVVSALPGCAEDSDRFRPYLGLKFFDTNPATGVHDLYGFSLGANVNRYFGFELSADTYQVFPDISPYGTIGEYGVLALIPQARLRYPVFDDK